MAQFGRCYLNAIRVLVRWSAGTGSEAAMNQKPELIRVTIEDLARAERHVNVLWRQVELLP